MPYPLTSSRALEPPRGIAYRPAPASCGLADATTAYYIKHWGGMIMPLCMDGLFAMPVPQEL